ncbi:unnamed protein product [Paramecium sonneborni]|uniref:Uncharacterized protein n=1 Tax=Paramecium sonneborni TaxID=65129 RepID=A0A8S1Q405_9CILI|nr:unnamed protein product [Paramecium sonneborni]
MCSQYKNQFICNFNIIIIINNQDSRQLRCRFKNNFYSFRKETILDSKKLKQQMMVQMLYSNQEQQYTSRISLIYSKEKVIDWNNQILDYTNRNLRKLDTSLKYCMSCIIQKTLVFCFITIS